jgi:hypothetical protein
MADRHVVLKNATKEIAWAQGKAVTFMAKWDFGLAGSSSHIHMSLADKAGKPMFVDSQGRAGHERAVMKHFMAGQLAYAREITYFLAPYINSATSAIQAGTFRADQGDLVARTIARRASASAGSTARRSASNAAWAAPTSIPTSPSPR